MPSFSEHYASLHTEVLLDIARKDLLDEARDDLNAELQRRGLPAEEVTMAQLEGANDRESENKRTAYLGSRASRFIAFAIDFWGAAVLLAVVLLPIRTVSIDLYSLAVLVSWLSYVLLRDAIPGQGLGKRLFGLRVIQQETRRACTWQSSIVRNLTHLFFWIDAIFILGKRRLRLGDHLANTLVIKRIANEARNPDPFAR